MHQGHGFDDSIHADDSICVGIFEVYQLLDHMQCLRHGLSENEITIDIDTLSNLQTDQCVAVLTAGNRV
jgi:hypothetical protein